MSNEGDLTPEQWAGMKNDLYGDEKTVQLNCRDCGGVHGQLNQAECIFQLKKQRYLFGERIRELEQEKLDLMEQYLSGEKDRRIAELELQLERAENVLKCARANAAEYCITNASVTMHQVDRYFEENNAKA